MPSKIVGGYHEAAAATQLALSGLGTLAECNGRIAGQLSGVADGSLSLLPSLLHPVSILQAWPVNVISPVEGLKKVPKWMEGTLNFGATFHGFGV